MSIATQEAEKKYPVLHDEALGQDAALLDYENEQKQEGFVDGRTAPVTDEEVSAGASEIEAVAVSHHLVDFGGHISCSCGLDVSGEAFDQHWDNMAARAVLETARKKVAE